MNKSDVFNVILLGSGAAIFVLAKIRGREGKLCLETLFAGLAVLGAYGAIDSVVSGDAFMGAVVGLVAVAAAITVFDMRSKRMARDTPPRADSE